MVISTSSFCWYCHDFVPKPHTTFLPLHTTDAVAGAASKRRVGLDGTTDGLVEVHTLSISDGRVDACAISPSGEWLAFGCAALGQLLVWEWRSDSYVLKQQGHFVSKIHALAYSPAGTVIATAGSDAKVKLWSPATGLCFVTFAEHEAPVSAVAFLPSGHALLSASLDGTVRAFDLMRYRNFRVMTSPDPCQFVSLAVDPTGEIVCAGA